MGKLHEVLAVEGDLAGQAQREMDATKHLFREGQSRLVGKVRTYQPIDEEGLRYDDEVTVLADTVWAALSRLSTAFGKWLDASLQKEVTNRSTGADVIIDGEVIFENLPTPALLNLENKLAALRSVLVTIPTLDPVERWEWDDAQERYLSAPRVQEKTAKIPKSLVTAEATKEHPAQVEVYYEGMRVGEWTTIIHSGMYTPHRKRMLLEKLDSLLRAVKQARQRANDVEADAAIYSTALLDYLFGE